MDNLCHTLVGAAFGEAGLKHRVRHGNAILMVAANIPDVDVLGFVTSTPAVAIRRGWTHGLLAQALLPVLFSLAIVGVERVFAGPSAPRSRLRPLLLLSYIGVLSHVGLDWLNNYGVRLLMPWSNEWFYGDSIFIVDPFLWLVLAAGVWLARRRARNLAAVAAIGLACIYIAGMVWSARAARREVRDAWIEQRGGPPHALMVGPAFANPLRRVIIVDAGDAYYSGAFEWLPTRIAFNGRVVPRLDQHPAVVRAREHPDIRAVLVWARFPYYEVEPVMEGTRVTVRDMRFGARVGQVSVVVGRE
jgi:inner membrane protein